MKGWGTLRFDMDPLEAMNCAKFMLLAYITHSSYFVTVGADTVHMYLRVSLDWLYLRILPSLSVVRNDHLLLYVCLQPQSRHPQESWNTDLHWKTSPQPQHVWPVRAIYQTQTQYAKGQPHDQPDIRLCNLVWPSRSYFDARLGQLNDICVSQGDLRVQYANYALLECPPPHMASIFFSWILRRLKTVSWRVPSPRIQFARL